MTAFEPGSSGIRNDHAVNCATTTAQFPFILNVRSKFKDLPQKFVGDRRSFQQINLFTRFCFHLYFTTFGT